MHFMVKYSAHNISDEEKPKLSKQILIFFLPHNVTNKHQLADMDIISSIKVGYKVTLLEQLLSIFDTKWGYLREYAKKEESKERM